MFTSPTYLRPFDDDTLHEECGVFGIFRHEEAAAMTALGLHALQHRGQEAAGITSHDGEQFLAERRFGLVGDHFNKKKIINKLMGNQAIGHVRYSTTGGPQIANIQPLYADISFGGLSVCHNGNLTNALTLRNDLIKNGAIFQSTSDTEVVLHLVSRSKSETLLDRLTDALKTIEGAYAFVGMTKDKMIGVRDPDGIRPLVLGRLDGAYVLASETCALDMIGAKLVREIENGEVIIIDENGMQSHHPFTKRPSRPCIFEYIYFSRPDSIVDGRSIYEVRKNMGEVLAEESHADSDIVVPIPDSGLPAAIGYSNTAGIPFELGIIRNHYVGRTFIEPEQKIRKLGVKLKHSANIHTIRGKRVVLVDDSVVRGTTSKKIVQMIREAGAKEVHMRISSPPIRFPDFYGIDTPEKENLMAAIMDIEAMRQKMGADSLAFLSVDGLYRALGHEKRDDEQPQYTDHCFTGDYPTPLKDYDEDLTRKKFSELRLVS